MPVAPKTTVNVPGSSPPPRRASSPGRPVETREVDAVSVMSGQVSGYGNPKIVAGMVNDHSLGCHSAGGLDMVTKRPSPRMQRATALRAVLYFHVHKQATPASDGWGT